MSSEGKGRGGGERYESTDRQEKESRRHTFKEDFPMWSLWVEVEEKRVLRGGWTGKAKTEKTPEGFEGIVG